MDMSVILWGLVFGSIGFGYYIYGKKQSNIVARICGVVLIVYPYFIDATVVLIVVGVIIMLIPKFVKP